MSESEYEYVDEQGNPLSPEEVAALGDDYEVVDEDVPAPVQTAPAPASAAPEAAPQTAAPAVAPRKASKAVLAVAAVAVLGIGGVVAYGMHSIGQQATVDDVKAAVSSKASAVSSAVESERAEIVDARGEYLTGQTCPVRAVEGAQWAAASDPLPEYQLRQVGATRMPAGFRERVSKKAKGEPREVLVLQLSESQFGAYVSGASVDTESGRSTWWKALIGVSGAEPAVLGDGQGTGRDADMRGACDGIAEGPFLVMDDDAEETPSSPTTLLALKPAKDSDGVVYAVSADGEQLLKLRVAQTPAEARTAEGGDASSSAAVPSK